jgi:alginate O-acetyltransferase complex protein AlgI
VAATLNPGSPARSILPLVVFTSIEFVWLFMPLVLLAYLLAPPGWRNGVLAALSLVFYAWGAHATLLLFLASIAMNFVAGRLIHHFRERGDERAVRRTMWIAVAANLSLLFFWKYAVFAATQFNRVIGLTGSGGVGVPDVVLPIGISFFTFHGISYIVDITRGDARPLRNPLTYAQYMAFFPQLIAGPIVRYREIDDQLLDPPPRSQRLDDFADGFPRFALGFAKKVLIADPAGAVADAAFSHSGGGLASTTAWLGVFAYTTQIYFDFSGYSDMAIGMARMFGLRFPENFNRPYSAVSLTDFWRRWHMTLSRWFRDYVYIPLGGSRGTQGDTVRNLMVVFFLTGAWHGANWTFVAWGLYHGALLVGERLTGIRTWADDHRVAVRRALTLVLVMLGWALFRAGSFHQAADFWRAMLIPSGGGLPEDVRGALNTETIFALAVGLASVLLPRSVVMGRLVQAEWSGRALLARGAVLLVLPWAAITVAAGSFSPFLYFRF